VSGVIIAKSNQFTVMCSDRIALPTNARGERLLARTHKVFRVVPGVYAAAVGVWEHYTTALNAWSQTAADRPSAYGATSTLGELLQRGERDPVRLAEPLGELLRRGDPSGTQSRVYLVLCEPYLVPQDVAQHFVQTIVTLEGAGYPPRMSNGSPIALPSVWLSNLFVAIWEREDTLEWRRRGAICQAQLIEAFMTMAAMLSPDLDSELDTIIVGPRDRYTAFRGGLLELPIDYIF
jgi:hypothetical protein